MRHWHDIQLQSDCFRSVIKGSWILDSEIICESTKQRVGEQRFLNSPSINILGNYVNRTFCFDVRNRQQ